MCRWGWVIGRGHWSAHQIVAATIPRLVIHMAARPVSCVIVGLAASVMSGGSGARQAQEDPITSMVMFARQLLQVRVMAVTSVQGNSTRRTGLPAMPPAQVVVWRGSIPEPSPTGCIRIDPAPRFPSRELMVSLQLAILVGNRSWFPTNR